MSRFRYNSACVEGDFFIIDSEKKLPPLLIIYSTDEIVDDWVRFLNSVDDSEMEEIVMSIADLERRSKERLQ